MLPAPGQYPSPFPKAPAVVPPVPAEIVVQAHEMPPFPDQDEGQAVSVDWWNYSFAISGHPLEAAFIQAILLKSNWCLERLVFVEGRKQRSLATENNEWMACVLCIRVLDLL